jgi:DNA mismatch repair protein MutS
VLTRAREILTALEHDELSRGGRPSPSGTPPAPQQQLGLFERVASEADEKLKARLREIDLNRTTPMDALQILAELKQQLD